MALTSFRMLHCGSFWRWRSLLEIRNPEFAKKKNLSVKNMKLVKLVGCGCNMEMLVISLAMVLVTNSLPTVVLTDGCRNTSRLEGEVIELSENEDLPDPCISEDKESEVLEDGVDDELESKIGFGLSNNPDDVEFMLYYSPKHPKRYDRLHLNEELTIKTARFKKNTTLIFIAHGFMSSAGTANSTFPIIKNALLGMSIVNIIGVDWSKLATSPSQVAFLSYCEVTQHVPIVGRRIADMIEFLIELNIISGPEQVHLIGHSLGAHVMGVAGYEIKNRTGKLIDHITGLDPAGPLYPFINLNDKLDPTDAAYIDVLHTDVGRFGSGEILGTADFFANGGKGFAQPGCLNFTNTNLGAFVQGISGICSHSRAYKIYGRSIQRTKPEFYGCRCRYQAPFILPTSCTLQEKTMCPDKVLYGYYGPRTAKGNYFVDTSEATDIQFFNLGSSIFDPIDFAE